MRATAPTSTRAASPAQAWRGFYAEDALLTFEGQQVQGRQAIEAKLRDLSNVDSQRLSDGGVLTVVVGKLGFDDSAVDFTETFVQTLTGNHLSLSHHVFRLAFSPAWRRWLWSRAAPGRGRPLPPAAPGRHAATAGGPPAVGVRGGEDPPPANRTGTRPRTGAGEGPAGGVRKGVRPAAMDGGAGSRRGRLLTRGVRGRR
ncbi:ketosteroid isomerase family protein [Kitasatospora sp. NPDC001119]